MDNFFFSEKTYSAADGQTYKVVASEIQIHEDIAMNSAKLRTKHKGQKFVAVERKHLHDGGMRLRLQEGGWTSLTSSEDRSTQLVQRETLEGIGVIDWQLMRQGSCATDLAYSIDASLTLDSAQNIAFAKELKQAYYDQLTEGLGLDKRVYTF